MTFADTREIYNRMQDEISQKLFAARLSVSATGNAGYLTMLPAEYRNLGADIEIFRNRLLLEDHKQTIIFGAGFNGVAIARQIPVKSLAAFIDNFRCGQTEPYTNLPIYSLKDYIRRFGSEDTKFVISVSDRSVVGKMYVQLADEGVKPESVLTIPAEYRNSTSQYFDLLTPDEHETFVDCGCYDASTAFHFAGWCGGKGYDKIWCFEPDRDSYQTCKELCSGLAGCKVYPYGISDRAGTAPFQSGRKEESRIVKTDDALTDNVIETIVLDEFLRGERVTFIKMDIEGAELDALRGASQIIKEQKPKLAISVYHRDDDIVAIPKLLTGLRPDYKLYLRHYSLLLNETVLYAC